MPDLIVFITDHEAEYVRAYYHLHQAENLDPEQHGPDRPYTAPFDFLPPELETRLVESIVEGLRKADSA